MIALALLAGLQEPTSASVSQFSCRLFDAQGSMTTALIVNVRPPAADDSATGGHLRLEIRSSNQAYPTIENVPASERDLASGDVEVVSWSAPERVAQRIGYRLSLPYQGERANGYAMLMADGPGTHFEVPGYQPVAAGICIRTSGDGQ